MNTQGWWLLGCLVAALVLLTVWKLLVCALRVVECAACMARDGQDCADKEDPYAR